MAPTKSNKPVAQSTVSPAPKAPGIKKQYRKSPAVCRVTLTLPKEAAPSARSVCVVGEFNGWSPEATALKRGTNGDFSVSLDLEPGRSYRFRYLIDGCRYENDWQADRYEANPYGGEDSVVEV